MASDENHIDDLDDDESDSDDQQQLDGEEEFDDVLEEEDDDLNLNSAVVTVAVPAATPQITAGPEPNRHPIEQQQQQSQISAITVHVEKKPQQPLDEQRKLFQRLWTDEDEIELLQGFLEYTTQRGSTNSQYHHYDTTVFYDQIKSRLQLEFNKNQLVEKLRRLKKKYRTVVSRISSGKEFIFKSPHDQATFFISRKIWGDLDRVPVGIEETGFDDEENPNLQPTNNLNFNNTSVNNHGNNENGIDASSAEKKVQRSKKRARVKIEEKGGLDDKGIASMPTPSLSINGLTEEMVRSCFSPLFKELLSNAMNGQCSGGMRAFGAGMLSPVPLNFNGSLSVGNILGGEIVDEKWRKQQILELEVYSKRLDLVQDQIRATLEELRSAESS